MLVLPEAGLGWLAPVVLVPWLLLLTTAPTGGESALRGWWGGAGFVAAVHHWLLPAAGPFLLVVAGLVGALWAATACRALVAMLVVPAGWLLVEVVRSQEHLGGPWGLLGTSQWQVQAGRDLAALGGTWLVTAALVALNTAVLLAVRRGPRITVLATATALVAVSLAWSSWHADAGPDRAPRSGSARAGRRRRRPVRHR